MRGCLTILGVLVALVVIGIGSCTFVYGPTHVRFRLKVNVRDGDVIRTGSGVISIGYTSNPPFLPIDSPVDWGLSGITGNAVTVDLGAKGLLFAIVRDSSGAAHLPFAAYGLPLPYSGAQLRAVLPKLEHKSGWVQVPLDAMPLLIHFKNINDPDSAQKVDPSNLAASFGPGVKLEDVMLKLTDDAITPVPPVWPTWIKNLGESEFMDHGLTCWTTPFCLQGADFTGN